METLNFETIYKKNRAWVKNYINQRINDKETAEDLTCNVFVKLAKYIKGFDPEKSTLNTYLNIIIKSVIIDYTRSKQYKMKIRSNNIESYVNEEGDSVFQVVSINDTSSNIVENELKNLIEKAIGTIKSDNTRKVCRMAILEEYKLEDIATELNIPYNSVKVYIHRFREMMQPIVRKQYAM